MWGIEPVCWCPVVVGHNIWACRGTPNWVGRPSQHKPESRNGADTDMPYNCQQEVWWLRQGKGEMLVKVALALKK